MAPSLVCLKGEKKEMTKYAGIWRWVEGSGSEGHNQVGFLHQFMKWQKVFQKKGHLSKGWCQCTEDSIKYSQNLKTGAL